MKNEVDNIKTNSIDSSDEQTLSKDASEKQDIPAADDSSVDNQHVESSQVEDDDSSKWYIVQTYSGHEYKVVKRITQFIEDKRFEGKLFRVLFPEHDTVEIKNNKRIERKQKIYPGYVFVKMHYDKSVSSEITCLPGVSRFIGITEGQEPAPVVEAEILKVLRKIGDKTKEIEVDFEIGESIKIIDGPFRGYTGAISEINPVKGKLKSMISIFGRETPVELDFGQVEKAV